MNLIKFNSDSQDALIANLKRQLEDERKAHAETKRIHTLGSHAGSSCDMLAARLVAVEKERDELRKALMAAADAINEGQGWHDEGLDDDGNETCEPAEPCSCTLVNLVNKALE